MRKNIGLLFLCGITLAGCRSAESDAELASGGNVNRGPGPSGDIVKCAGKIDGRDASFLMMHTAAVTVKDGRFSWSKDPLSTKDSIAFYCRDYHADARHPDQDTPLYTCQQKRNGDGKYLITVYTQGMTGKVAADLEIEQMLPLKPKKIGTIFCGDIND